MLAEREHHRHSRTGLFMRQASLRPEVKSAVIEFLRNELPADAKRVYREMIRNDPSNWSRDPHFEGGIIVLHMLRGNGLDERALGVADLEVIWPELLRLAVEDHCS